MMNSRLILILSYESNNLLLKKNIEKKSFTDLTINLEQQQSKKIYTLI